MFSVSPEDPQELESNIDMHLYSPSVVKCAVELLRWGRGRYGVTSGWIQPDLNYRRTAGKGRELMCNKLADRGIDAGLGGERFHEGGEGNLRHSRAGDFR